MPETSAPSFQTPRSNERTFPTAAIASAGGIVALLVVILVVVAGKHHTSRPNQPLPLDPYAAHLSFSQLAMSESTSLSGGKSTFLDGKVSNQGDRTVSGVTVQVFFRNDEGMPPQIETLPVSLVRTRKPYIDTQPVSASPLGPGESRDFRLIFESIPQNWNTQIPDVHSVHVSAK